MSATFDAQERLRPYRIWDGAIARAVSGERIQLATVEIVPDSLVPEHSHPNEQVGIVLRGRITMTIAGQARDLGPGETYVIPGDVPHSGRTGPEGVTVIDTFSPPRADWERLERGEPAPGLWP